MQQVFEERVKSEEKVKKVNWDKLDIGIEYEGRAIKLPGDPANMPTEKAIEALERKLADDNQVYDMEEVIDAYPLDAGDYALRYQTRKICMVGLRLNPLRASLARVLRK